MKPQNSRYSPLLQGKPYIVPVPSPVQPQYAPQGVPVQPIGVPVTAKPGTGQQVRPDDVMQQRPIWPSQGVGVGQNSGEVTTASPATKHENSDDVIAAASGWSDDKQDCKTVYEMECNEARYCFCQKLSINF